MTIDPKNHRNKTTSLRHAIDRSGPRPRGDVRTYDIPGCQVHSKLRHDEKWVRRGFVKDEAYDKWGNV